MNENKRLAAFKESWQFDRSLTLDLLGSLDQSQLLFCPGENVGPLWKQFRHLGRVQENYLQAIDNGSVKFTPENASYTGACHKTALLDYLTGLDALCHERLACQSLPENIDWFGQSLPLADHLFRMLSHEVLHHGQLIVYCRLGGFKFPASWSIWGL